MNALQKLENGQFNLVGFSEEQIIFIKSLVKLAYNDGLDVGEKILKEHHHQPMTKMWDDTFHNKK